jgi:hypothetical protein
MWMRILFVLLIIVCFVMALLSPEVGLAKPTLPPHYEQWLKTCRAEQPSGKPGKWASIKWRHDGAGITYPGGCGFTMANWENHKPKGAPERMSQATAAQQLWACENIYRFYLKQSGSHRYAATVWDANRSVLGWYGFTEETW